MTSNSNVVVSSKGATNNNPNVFEMLKPSGWYKDKEQIDFQMRIDKKIPKIAHPLSYLELKKYGYDNLLPVIMELGGPVMVGNLIGLNWTEPIPEKEIWDESLRPKRITTYFLDNRGSLSLGSALEERMLDAERLDLESIKSKINEQSSDLSINDSPLDNNRNPDIQYNQNKPKKIIYDSNENKSNSIPSGVVTKSVYRFNLSSTQRLHLSILLVSISVGWGRASQDIVSNHIWGANSETIILGSQIISFILAISSIISAAASTKISMDNKSLDPLICAAKGLFGGPNAVIQLSQIDKTVIENA
eukprot:gene4942-6915_t